jgi:hypothetical protein
MGVITQRHGCIRQHVDDSEVIKTG